MEKNFQPHTRLHEVPVALLKKLESLILLSCPNQQSKPILGRLWHFGARKCVVHMFCEAW
jgi:hypothetical protein